MAIRSILVAPDPRLKAKSEAVDAVDDETRKLMDDLLDTMTSADGIGLAAPQVGVLKRVIVVAAPRGDEDDDGQGRSKTPLKMANPEIVWESDDTSPREEGCLSLPEHYAEVVRPERVRVRYLDADNKAQEIEADGLLGTCIQHEMDHLDGVLFVDHISALKRGIILRKLTKSKKLGLAATG
ncbi:MAG: peptide deformylase [Rhodospirillales bacterium]|nr:peptide deformylase [Rhodospirillales bacterium]